MAKEPSPRAQLEQELVIKLRKMPQDWASFSEPIDVPADIGAALMTGRAELLSIAARPMDKEEVRKLLNVLRVLMETNQLLKEHAAMLAQRAHDFVASTRSAVTQACRIEAFANFETESGIEDEDNG